VSGTTVETARQTIAWWEGVGGAILGGLIGAFVGSFIPLGWQKYVRAVERRGELKAMQAELYHAKIAMRTLREAQPIIAAPLYLLPLTTFERALPKLIGEGALADADDVVRQLCPPDALFEIAKNVLREVPFSSRAK
jgi:hypothetical protein